MQSVNRVVERLDMLDDSVPGREYQRTMPSLFESLGKPVPFVWATPDGNDYFSYGDSYIFEVLGATR